MTAQRKYICQFCAKAFSRTEHKARHERSHTKEKPFRCQQCDSSFVRRDLLQRHCRSVHDTIISFNTRKNSQATLIALQPHHQGETMTKQEIRQNGVVIEGSAKEPVSFTNPSFPSSSLLAIMNPNLSPKHSPRESLLSISLAEPLEDGKDMKAERSIEPRYNALPEPIAMEVDAGCDAPKPTAPLKKTATRTSHNAALTGEKSVITILSLSKRLSLALFNAKFHVNLSQQEISQYFISWSIVSNERIPLVKVKDLLPIVNSPLFQNAHSALPASMTDEELRNNALILAIISFGAADSHQFRQSLVFFKKSWYYLVNFMKNPRDAMPVLSILSYVSLNYNFRSVLHKYREEPRVAGTISTQEFTERQKYGKVDVDEPHRYQFGSRIDNRYTSFNPDDVEDETVIPTEVVLDYLNHISHLVVLPRSGNPPTRAEETFDYWWVYLILSNYSLLYTKPAPKIHEVFLSRELPGPGRPGKLRDYLNLLTTSRVKIHRFTMLEKIIIICLSNEHKYLTEKEHVLEQASQLVRRGFFGSLSFFHNAVILANRSFTHLERESLHDARASAVNPMLEAMDSGNGFYNQLIDEFNNLIILNQKKLLINCPGKLHELITSYNFVPVNEYQWYLLLITLKEFNLNMTTASADALADPAHRLHRQFHGRYNYRKLYYSLLKTKFDDVCAEVTEKQIYSYHELISSDVYLNETELKELTREFSAFLHLPRSRSSNHSNKLTMTDASFHKGLVITNNLGLVSIPMLFLSFNFNFTLSRYKVLLNLPKFSNGDNNSKDYFNLFLVEWVLTLFRVFLNLKNLDLEENYILQSLVYMIQETGFNIEVPLNVTNRNSFNDRYNSLSSSNLNLDHVKDDKVIYYYLKNIEMCFDIWYKLNNDISNEFTDLEEYLASTGRRRGQLTRNEVFLRNFKQLLRTTVYDNLDLSLTNYISPIRPLSPTSMSTALHGTAPSAMEGFGYPPAPEASTLESILSTSYIPSPSATIGASFLHFPSGERAAGNGFVHPIVPTLFLGTGKGEATRVTLPPIEDRGPKPQPKPAPDYPPLMGLSLSGYAELMVMRNNVAK